MIHQKKILLIMVIFLQSVAVFAKDYKASMFNIKSDGSTMNTRSIQFGIDYISKNGGFLDIHSEY